MASRWLPTACVAAAFALAAGAARHGGVAAQSLPRDGDRPVFDVLISGFRFTEPEIRIEGSPPEVLELHANWSAAPTAPPSFTTSVNDVAARTAAVSTARGPGVDRAVYRFTPGTVPSLKNGRNEITVSHPTGTATQTASFVVDFREPPKEASAGVRIAREFRRALAADNAEPLDVDITIPAKALVAGAEPVLIAGTIRGPVVSVTILGNRATIKPRSAGSGVEFRGDVSVPRGATQIAVEALDRSGNMTRVLLKVDTPAPVLGSAFRGRRAAVLVGVARYRFGTQGLGDLKYPVDDVTAMRDLLLDPAIGGFAGNDVITLTNENATVAAVDDALTRTAGRLGPDDLLFVYLSSHGSADPYSGGATPFYFLLHDTRFSNLAGTALPMTALEPLVNGARSKAGKKLFLIDACRSGAAADEIMKRATQGLDRAARTMVRHDGVALMTSSTAGEPSQERDTLRHSVFTHALLRGLRGSADTNHDGLITAGELFDTAAACVVKLTNEQQHPQLLTGSVPDLPIARSGANGAANASPACGGA